MPVHIPTIEAHYRGRRAFSVHSAQNMSLSKKERGKKPKPSAWQHTKPVNDFSGFINCEAGMALDADMLVIDVDVSNGKQGIASFKRLCADLGRDLFSECTFKVQTGSGGYHLYFAKDPAQKIKKKNPRYPDIDFLSEGCFVVCAGSEHACGGRYEVISNNDGRTYHDL